MSSFEMCFFVHPLNERSGFCADVTGSMRRLLGLDSDHFSFLNETSPTSDLVRRFLGVPPVSIKRHQF